MPNGLTNKLILTRAAAFCEDTLSLNGGTPTVLTKGSSPDQKEKSLKE